MDTLTDLLLFSLIAIAVAPLLVLGVYIVADYFKLSLAERILDLLGHLLTLQWVTGGMVNIAGGLALAALGGWMVFHVDARWPGVLCVVLVPFGLWRAWRGYSLLRA